MLEPSLNNRVDQACAIPHVRLSWADEQTILNDMNDAVEKSCAVGDEAVVDITDIAFGGEGVGRWPNGIAVFVPYVAPGESVQVRITEVKSRHARGIAVEINSPHPARMEPRCSVYGICAGCQYQHLAYETQCELKEQQVRTLLQRIGGFAEPPVAPLQAAPHPWEYRSRITLHGPGVPAYIGVDGATRVPICECPIARPEINEALKGWSEEHPEGLPDEGDLTLRMDRHGRVWPTTGKDHQWIDQRIAGRDFIIPLGSFTQVNPSVADLLVEHIVARVHNVHPDLLIDAYAGVGVFGILAAAAAKQVVAIESDAYAVKAGRKNARQLGGRNVEFVGEPTESALPRLLRRLDSTSVCCVLDPPRAGCPASVLNALIQNGVQRILYVSCAPDRLARDARRLCGAGYQLDQVTPFDMFPQTRHIEVVAEFVGN